MRYKKAYELVKKAQMHDKYHEQRGDNYLFKNEWRRDENKYVRRKGKLYHWRIAHKYWNKTPDDLSVHGGVHYDTFSKYEKQVNPRYRRDQYGREIYAYDNPLGCSLDKYNDNEYTATTRGYAKKKNRTIASIDRKRDKVIC